MTIYDQFNALETPELSPSATRKHQSYFCKVSQHEDSDVSSVSSLEEATEEAHRPIWWNILDAESAAATEAGLHNYKDFLRDQLHKDHTFKQQPKARASLTMTKIEGMFVIGSWSAEIVLMDRQLRSNLSTPTKSSLCLRGRKRRSWITRILLSKCRICMTWLDQLSSVSGP